MSRAAFDLGFRTLERELTDYQLPVEGSIPKWLSGALIRNGPGAFEIGDRRVSHWFDGFALLRRYGFEDGDVRYTNRFLRSEAYEAAKRGETVGEFATGASGLEALKGWLTRLGPPNATDNASVHVAPIGEAYVALTESPRWVAFDPVTLETHGEFSFDDDLPTHLATAHLVVDDHRGETIGYATEFGRPHQYHLYRIPHGSGEREHISSVCADGPGYVHSCALTPQHIVILEVPLHINVLRALSPWSQGFADLLEYRPERGTRILVVDRETGELRASPRVDPFFVFHHINAFEADGEIVMDLVEFDDDEILEAMTFDALREDAFAGAPDGRLARFRVDPATGRVSREYRYDGGIELPTVPPSVRTQPYRYAYGQVTDRDGANGLVKVDLETGTAREWWERGVYVEEPLMVRRPGTGSASASASTTHAEDDGVILAAALDTNAERTMLLVFDAATLSELARAPLPIAVPFGFHGRYVRSV